MRFLVPLGTAMRRLGSAGLTMQSYYPEEGDEVMVWLVGPHSYRYRPTVEGSVLRFEDRGELRNGVYDLLVTIRKANGDRLRTKWPGVLNVVDETPVALADIEEESDVIATEEWTELVAAAYEAVQGDKGDPGDDADVTAFEERVATAEKQIATKQDTLASGENIKTVNGQSLLGSGNMLIGDDWQFLVQYKTAEGATYPLPTADSFDGLLIHFIHEYRSTGTGIPIYGFSHWVGTLVMRTTISEDVVLVEKRGDAIILLAGASEEARGPAIRVRQWDESCRNDRPYFSIPASGALKFTDSEYITIYIKPRKDND